ncbi:MAG: HEPN domain-containing protein [Christensenellaceae bacterium]|jgi:HEPN domain-containing protein|nr:HEPN domain-containing protein [Christensenellaceae bacterium]
MNPLDLMNAVRFFTAALADLRAASVMAEGAAPHAALVCFHCRLAALQMLKGLLAFHGSSAPQTQSVQALLELPALHAALGQAAPEGLLELDQYGDELYLSGALRVAPGEMRRSVEAVTALKERLAGMGYPLPTEG